LKSSGEEQVLQQSEETADYEVEFEEIDGQWTASLSINGDYLSSLGFNQSEVSELQKLIGELFLKSQVKFCKGQTSPTCFPEMLSFLQVLNINIQNIAKTGSTHPAMWDDDAHQDIDHLVPHNYKWHPIVGGSLDGVVDATTSIPVLIYTAGEVMLDEEKQQAFVGMFSKEGWHQLVEGIFSSIATTLSDEDKIEHAVSKASIELALAYYIALGKAAEGIKEALENALGLAKKIEKSPNLQRYLKKIVKDNPDPVKAKRLEALLEIIQSSDLEKILAKLDNSQIDDFIADISGDATLARKFASEELSVDAWKRAHDLFPSGSKFITDIPTLERISKLSSEGSTFRTKLGSDWSKALDDILKNASDLKCSSCGNAGRVGRSSMDQYLDDVDHFVSNFTVTSGGKGETFFNWMRNSTNPTPGQLDELHQTIRDFAKREIKESQVEGLGKQFPVGTKRYDLRRVGDKYTEYKNKDFVGSPLTAGSDDVDQFLNGYLKNVKSMNDLEWKAGYDKLKS
ncbi:MAG: hypothetical protein RJQ14_19760, partial [Marinoscillum sp.]